MCFRYCSSHCMSLHLIAFGSTAWWLSGEVMFSRWSIFTVENMLTQNMCGSIQGNWNVIGWQHKTAMIQGPNVRGDLGHDRWWVDASWDEALVAGKLTENSYHWIEQMFTESLKAQLSSTGPVKRLPMLDALGTACWTVELVDPNICCWDMFKLSRNTGFTLLGLSSVDSYCRFDNFWWQAITGTREGDVAPYFLCLNHFNTDPKAPSLQ